MTDLEMLQAIKQVVGEAVQPLEVRMGDLETGLKGVQEEVHRTADTVDNIVLPQLKALQEEVKVTQTELKAVKEETHRTADTVDNIVLPQLEALQEETHRTADTVDNIVLPRLKAVQEEVRRVAITQENTVIPQINLIYENQVEIIQEHRRMQQLETDTSILNDEVSVLQHVAKDHAKRLAVLEQAR